ncbi:MAG: site-2 protease family protein, partial [Firmicutes bacterium]|nr:site-2 protease family protein [Bacillota bacterium]
TISDISGPVGIVQMVGETSNQGLWSYGFLVALICVNLAVINMLPLPALDGGRILIVLVCWITGKAVSPKIEGIIHAVGIVLLLGLAVLVTFSDIRKLVG